MKKTRKLVPAIALLLISALLLSTASYAWFSMNTQVTATGMTVTAKSNATYLLIGTTDNARDKSTSDTTKAATNASATIYPAAFEATSGTSHAGYTTNAANQFYTANNGNTDNATNDMQNGKGVNEGDSSYMLTNTFYITLTEDSEDYTGNLTVTFELVSGDASTSAVVKVGTTYIPLNSTTTSGTASVSLTKSTSQEVLVYTYVDGNSTNVYSDYDDDLNGEISLTFAIER